MFKCKPGVVYQVTRGNKELQIGDLVWFSQDGSMYLNGPSNPKNGKYVQTGWLEPEEITPEIMDFEAVPLKS